MEDQLSTPEKILTAAHNRILQYNHQREFAAENRQPQSGRLYHYTTADGIKGIVENNTLWATSAYYLNDAAEIMYGYHVLAEALNEWVQKNALSEDSLARMTADLLQRSFGRELLNRETIKPIYLCCFCEEDNLLSQWRAYGQSGGYCIGFQIASEGIVRGMVPEPCVYTAKCVKVEYARAEQLRRCLEILDALLPALDEPEVIEAIKSVDALSRIGFQAFYSTLSEILVEESIGFKNEAFSVEREWRIVVRSRELLKQGIDNGDHNNLPIHFRSARGLLVPYVKLIPSKTVPPSFREEDKLPLVSARCGPSGDHISAPMALRMLLDANQYRGVGVDHSRIPVAF